MRILEITQTAQEDEYRFPYHYVSTMPDLVFSQHFVDTWGINYISTIEFILSKICETPPESLIDIGCGDGRLAREIHLKFPNTKVLGVDYSARAINLAKAMNPDYHDLDFKQLDITKTKLPNRYESAVLMEVFEHIPLDEAIEFLSGVHRLIKPDGILYLTVPHTNKGVEYKHFQHFTSDSITQYLGNFFYISEIIPFEKNCRLRRLFNLLLCNRLFILNSRFLLKAMYRIYKNHLFHCNHEKQCQRLFVKAIAK